MFPNKIRQDLDDFKELISLNEEVKAVGLQDRLGKQSFHEDMKKVFEPLTKTLVNTSQDITKTVTETSIKITKQ